MGARKFPLVPGRFAAVDKPRGQAKRNQAAQLWFRDVQLLAELGKGAHADGFIFEQLDRPGTEGRNQLLHAAHHGQARGGTGVIGLAVNGGLAAPRGGLGGNVRNGVPLHRAVNLAREANGLGINALQELLGNQPRYRMGRIGFAGGTDAIGARQGGKDVAFVFSKGIDCCGRYLELIKQRPAGGQRRHDLWRNLHRAKGEAAFLELAGDGGVVVFYLCKLAAALGDALQHRQLLRVTLR